MARPNKTTKTPIPVGTRFGRWVVMEEDTRRGYSGQVYYICKCDCGTVRSVRGTGLRSGDTTSCGCFSADIRRKKDHAEDHELYKSWIGMKQRCSNPKCSSYRNYGGRGITVCKEWQEDFYAFESWSLANGYKDGLTIDRIDNNKGYFPENCRYVTYRENVRNRRVSHMLTLNGVTKNIYDWADEYGIQHVTMTHRWKRGWRGVKLISPPNYKMRNSLAKCEMEERYLTETPYRRGEEPDV